MTKTSTLLPWILPVKQSTGRRGILNNCLVGYKRNKPYKQQCLELDESFIHQVSTVIMLFSS